MTDEEFNKIVDKAVEGEISIKRLIKEREENT